MVGAAWSVILKMPDSESKVFVNVKEKKAHQYLSTDIDTQLLVLHKQKPVENSLLAFSLQQGMLESEILL